MTTAVGSLGRARGLLDNARQAYAGDAHLRRHLDLCAARLDQPLRLALAGGIKAGKSTLLNAIVGQDIAPTDATECTRVVTWYRNGPTPTVTARWGGDRRMNVPVQRRAGGLTFDLGSLTADRVDFLDVEWPASALADTTVIDTPGTSSLSRDISARTLSLLTPDSGPSGADAVVYLLQSLSAADTQFLGRIAAHVGADSGPLGVVGVLSRADEVGAGRLDAMVSVKDIAARFAGELERTGLCQAVVPVSGLLAFAARTLRQNEFDAFELLAKVDPDDLALAMLSADRFARPDSPLPVDAETRANLTCRFGMFGIRMAIMLIRLGVHDSPTLAAELVARSGLEELRHIIDVQFAQRADQLKAHSALVALDRVLKTNASPSTAELRANVARLLGDTHGFAELRLLGSLRTADIALPATHLAELSRLIGGNGVAPYCRLDLPADAPVGHLRAAATDAVRTWRSRAGHPLLNHITSRACTTAARSAEGILDTLITW